jgi:hypothetical protein
VFVQTVFAQYDRATSVEVQNGKPTAWWSEKAGAASTKIQVISPLPTIYYNCYYAGSLCKNLELTQTGAFAGTIDMELVYDKDTKRRNSRRRRICPGTWNRTTYAQSRTSLMSGYPTEQETLLSTYSIQTPSRSQVVFNLMSNQST